MHYHQTIFSIKELKSRVKNAFPNGISNREQKIKVIENWQRNISSGKYINAKEEEIRPLFLTQFFGDILDYEYNNATDWNLRFENKTTKDSTKSDAALGFFKIRNNEELPKDVRAVVEIKDARTPLDKPQNRKDFKGSAIEQCFMYASKIGESCKWVIVSNFLEIRLYLANDMTKYESFDIMSLTDNYEFSRFYYLLSNGQLFYESIPSAIDILLANRIEKERTITKEFYAEFQSLRELFFYHLKTHNPNIEALKLLQYAQTIMDRILFISVIKDYDLISYKALFNIENIVTESWLQNGHEMWRQTKGLFEALDKGLPPRIHKFNGGLFRTDNELDNLTIKDVFLKRLFVLNKYDFESDLNVNVLGHIFEQSITDIEILKKDIIDNKQIEYIETEDTIELKLPKSESNKRKKEGIFYTPENITQYIVKSTIGAWLEEQKIALGMYNFEEFPTTETEKQNQIKRWKTYQNQLQRIKILDPACGSGAFLTQAFDFLLQEWIMTIDVIDKLKGDKVQVKANGLFSGAPTEISQTISQIKKDIVNNNLFGVDLNHESVEITKLGLWLKSASKRDPLALLDNNIKCGNSLISDSSVSDKAFVWNAEFFEIMQSGGFDVVIGNPPYVSANNMDFAIRQYFNQSADYKMLSGKWDLFIPFVEKSLQLLNSNGYFSFIVPYGLLNQPFAENLRKWILSDFEFCSLADLHEAKIFDQATIPTCIPVIKKTKHQSQRVEIFRLFEGTFVSSHFIDIERYKTAEMTMFRTERLDETGVILNKIRNTGVPLGDLFYVSTGAEIHGKEQRTEKGELISGYSKFDVLHTQQEYGFKPYIEGSDIPKSRELGRYCFPKVKLFLDFDTNFERMRSPKFKELFESEKIVLRRSSGLLYILGTIDVRKIYTSEKCILIIRKSNLPSAHSEYNAQNNLSLKYLLGILNSKLIHLYYSSVYGGFIDVYPNYIKPLPIPINISTALQSEMEENVEKILELHQTVSIKSQDFQTIIKSTFGIQKSTEKLVNWFDLEWSDFLAEVKKSKGKITKKQEIEFVRFFEEQKQALQTNMHSIKYVDKQIDNVVYKLYDLTPDEIELVEKQVDNH